MKTLTIAVAIGSLCLAGCFNMGTRTDKIAPVRVDDQRFAGMDCRRLQGELNSITRRESQLAAEHAARRRSSKVQAFWIGVGKGDGSVGEELAATRGERESAMKAMALQGCAAATQAPSTMQPLPNGGTPSMQPQAQECVACGKIRP